MNDLKEIEKIKIDNCTIHICNNAIVTENEQEKLWQEFSKIAYELCTADK